MKKSKALVPRKGQSLERVIPRLQPDVLHQVIQRAGLEKCGEIVMLATPEQLRHIFDLDLWRPAEPGLEEQFDGGRFGEWMELLAESGDSAAAQKLTELDDDLVIAGLAQHALVFDSGADTTDDHGLAWEIGGYRLFARRNDSWDAIVAILIALAAEHADCFHRVMRGCRALSNSGYEPDGLDDLLLPEHQTLFELALEREQRREAQGYVTPAQARAFLRGIPTHCKFDYKFESRIEELAFLANTMMTGCSVQGRPFTKQQAKEAAAAVCKLGLENLPVDFLENHGFVGAFQHGWAMLHRDVGLFAAERLLEVLTRLRCDDRYIRAQLAVLHAELSKACRDRMPWRARDAFDVIAILDMPVWAALRGLIDQCPVLHEAIRASRNPRTHSVSASRFEFISENSQIAAIHQFVHTLPEMLRP